MIATGETHRAQEGEARVSVRRLDGSAVAVAAGPAAGQRLWSTHGHHVY